MIAHVEKMDNDRRQWTRHLYGVDWEDPSLYDLVVNIELISIEQACRLVSDMTREATLELSPGHRTAMDDFALACRVRAELALNPLTSNLEVEVDACGGSVLIKGNLFEEGEAVQQVAMAVPGVTALTVEEPPVTIQV